MINPISSILRLRRFGLDLLRAHRVSHLWLCHSMLNLFAIRTRFTPSVRKSAERDKMLTHLAVKSLARTKI